MFEELKKKTLKGTLAFSIILILIGLGLAGWNAMDAFYSIRGGVDFTALAPDEINNQLVKLDLTDNFGSYMEQSSRNTKTNVTTRTHVYYVIWTGDEDSTDWRYMSIKVPVKDEKKMDAMAENTYNGMASDPITFYGKIKKLDSTETRYFKDYLEDAGMTEADIEAGALLYYIDSCSQAALVLYIGLFVVGVLLLVYGIYRLASAASGSALKKLHKDIADAGFTEASIESDYRAAQSFDKKNTLKVGKLMTYYMAGVPRALPNSKIMWAYQNTVTHRTNGVKTGTTYNVMLFDELTPKGHTFAVANESVAQDMLGYLNATLPWVVIGYSDELKKLYNKDRAQFLQLRYNTCEHVAVEPSAPNA